jgi:hypothetical protein
MSLNELKAADKVVSKILSCSQELVEGAKRAAQQGDSLDSLERNTWSTVREIGFAALELFIHLQGQGDLGLTTQTPDGQTLHRSTEPAACTIRSIFGKHTFQQYTYSPGAKKAIELRPIDARMSLPEARWSYLLQEFSQLFCVDQAFGLAAQNMSTVFGGTFSVDTLESVNAQMGQDAERFLSDLPVARPDVSIWMARCVVALVPFIPLRLKYSVVCAVPLNVSAAESALALPALVLIATLASITTSLWPVTES